MFKNHYQDDGPDELLPAESLFSIFITIQVLIFQLAFLLYEEIFDSAKGCIFISDSWFSHKPWSRVPLSALQSIDLTRGISMCVWRQPFQSDGTEMDPAYEWRRYCVTRPAVVAMWMGELCVYKDGKRCETYISSVEKGWLINFSDARWVCSNMSDDSAAPSEHFAMPLSPSPPLDVCGPRPLWGSLTPAD